MFTLTLINTAHAVQSLVPAECAGGGPSLCDVCALMETVQNLVNLLTTIATPIAVIFILYAGLLLITSGGNPGNVSKARSVATSAIIGLALVMSSWIIVNTVLNSIYGRPVPWDTINCSEGSKFNIPPPRSPQ